MPRLTDARPIPQAVRQMTVTAPAKINLHLRVGPARADGFHPLVSWMNTIDLSDQIHFQPRPSPGIDLSCDDPSLPSDPANLVHRAAALVLPADGPGLKIRLQKLIPHGAGLGGGSSDAAATLLAVSAMLRKPIDLSRLAGQLGSDVPFFLLAPSAICTGRGEIVQPTAAPAPGWVCLILPELALPTPAVYRRFDELGLGDPIAMARPVDWASWASLPAIDLLPLLVNDMESAAFDLAPLLATWRAKAEQILGRIVRMSGSGSSLFTLFDAEEPARQASGLLQSQLHLRSVACRLCRHPSRMENSPLRTGNDHL